MATTAAYDKEQIEEIIGNIRDLVPGSRYSCLHGECFEFAKVLANVFPESALYMSTERDHVVIRIGNGLYDVTGYVGNAMGKAAAKYHEMDEGEMAAVSKWGSGSWTVAARKALPELFGGSSLD